MLTYIRLTSHCTMVQDLGKLRQKSIITKIKWLRLFSGLNFYGKPKIDHKIVLSLIFGKLWGHCRSGLPLLPNKWKDFFGGAIYDPWIDMILGMATSITHISIHTKNHINPRIINGQQKKSFHIFLEGVVTLLQIEVNEGQTLKTTPRDAIVCMYNHKSNGRIIIYVIMYI